MFAPVPQRDRSPMRLFTGILRFNSSQNYPQFFLHVFLLQFEQHCHNGEKACWIIDIANVQGHARSALLWHRPVHNLGPEAGL